MFALLPQTQHLFQDVNAARLARHSSKCLVLERVGAQALFLLAQHSALKFNMLIKLQVSQIFEGRAGEYSRRGTGNI